MSKTWRQRIAGGLVLAVAGVVSVTYVVPGLEVCRDRPTMAGATTCGPITTDDSLLVGLWLLFALLFVLPDLSELGIAGLVTLKTRVDGLAQRQDATERVVALTTQLIELKNSNSLNQTWNIYGDRAAGALRPGNEGAGQSDDLRVESALATQLGVLADVVQQTAASSPEEFATKLASSVTSAVALRPGQRRQPGGAVVIALLRPLGPEREQIRVALMTPGVTFEDEPPLLTSNVASGLIASIHRESDTLLLIDVRGPTAFLPVVTLSKLLFAVDRDVPPGTPVRASVSMGGGRATALSTIGSVGAAVDVEVVVAALPNVFIGGLDQATGLVSIIERQAGELGGDDARILRLRLVPRSERDSRVGARFATPPWLVVVRGDLKLDRGQLAVTQARGVLSPDGTYSDWAMYTSSTVRSIVEVRGSESAGALLASGPNSGPRIDVDDSRPQGALEMLAEALESEQSGAQVIGRIQLGAVRHY